MILFDYHIVRNTGQKILGYKDKIFTDSPIRNKCLNYSPINKHDRRFYHEVIVAMCIGCKSSREDRP